MKEIQKGLYLEIKSYSTNGKTYYLSFLTSADGYCFYDRTEEIYDEDGNIIVDVKPTQRGYMTKNVVSETNIDILNNTFISVPIEEGFEIV